MPTATAFPKLQYDPEAEAPGTQSIRVSYRLELNASMDSRLSNTELTFLLGTTSWMIWHWPHETVSSAFR